ncbi:hypothetical protein psal_cds_613 [Pandoravirus salinus]|uniref:Uncharacterized protein n=1 Tax=Pandoravirus salinus TaxID=1349410 RepID=S4VYH4_9VIRU|nr:hypothetical protein psal_cds_613 [Pandoravirus salinus]AGO84491.1 hypothetical protein psal_cds_613 [Pandoravirus salinus]
MDQTLAGMDAGYIQRRCIGLMEESDRLKIREACDRAAAHLAQQERKAAAARVARSSTERPVASDRLHQEPSLAALPSELLDKIAASIDLVGDMAAWSIATGLPSCDHRIVAAMLRSGIDTTSILCAGAPLHIVQAIAVAPDPLPGYRLSMSTIEAAAAGGRIDVFEWIVRGLRPLLPYWGTARIAAGCRALVGAAWRGHAHMIDTIRSALFPIVPLGVCQRIVMSVDGGFDKIVEVAVSRDHFSFLKAAYDAWPRECARPLVTWALVHDSPGAIEAVGGLAPLGYGPDSVFRCAVDTGASKVAHWVVQTYPRET